MAIDAGITRTEREELLVPGEVIDNAVGEEKRILEGRLHTYTNQWYRMENDFTRDAVVIQFKYKVPSITRVK